MLKSSSPLSAVQLATSSPLSEDVAQLRGSATLKFQNISNPTRSQSTEDLISVISANIGIRGNGSLNLSATYKAGRHHGGRGKLIGNPRLMDRILNLAPK